VAEQTLGIVLGLWRSITVWLKFCRRLFFNLFSFLLYTVKLLGDLHVQGGEAHWARPFYLQYTNTNGAPMPPAPIVLMAHRPRKNPWFFKYWCSESGKFKVNLILIYILYSYISICLQLSPSPLTISVSFNHLYLLFISISPSNQKAKRTGRFGAHRLLTWEKMTKTIWML
jgi:hypothetical protein